MSSGVETWVKKFSTTLELTVVFNSNKNYRIFNYMIKARKAYSIIFLCFLNIAFFSQTNLVPNPSFETYTACPTSIGEIPTNWVSYGGSPDYYNSCANSTSSPPVGVPSNWIGYQSAFDGNGYIGIATYYSASQREYIGAALTQTLSIGTKYFISAYISRQDTSNGSVGSACSANNFGFKFSKTAFSYTNPTPVNNFSHIYSTSIIYDTLNWRKISGSFIADSSYKYVAVGNFFDNSNTNTANCIYPFSIAYYYVDKICVSTDSMLCNISIGINGNNATENIKIYPNPVEDYLFFKNLNQFSDFKLYDVMGNEVEFGLMKDKLDLSNLVPGIYFLSCKRNREIYKCKILKK
jgi:hypothetical protein